MIELSCVSFAWPGRPAVLDDITLTVPDGAHVAVMGPNGSGKTSLARLMKGLVAPVAGTVSVDGFTAAGQAGRDSMMARVGFVFQNPDDTIVAATVERELAFGLENTGVPTADIRARVDAALDRFDLRAHRHANPLRLSGGERQRLAIAAVMIMRPKHLVLDEPTSLLDPWSRTRILALIHETARAGTTILHITQFPEDAFDADRVIVLDGGRIRCDGPPGTVFDDARWDGYRTLCGDEARAMAMDTPAIPPAERPGARDGGDSVCVLEDIGHSYDRGLPDEVRALDGVTLDLRRGTATAVLGRSGAGKTTLLEIAAGVGVPTAGRVVAGAILRTMAFQFPEDQLFGDTVGEYVAFGARNAGVPEAKLRDVASRSLAVVGLDPGAFLDRDPFTLSGGEKRRAAIAGVLAMHPDVLVLDEPTAGLDWKGRDLMERVLGDYVDGGGSLLFSTHDFGLAARLADRVVVLEAGRVGIHG